MASPKNYPGCDHTVMAWSLVRAEPYFVMLSVVATRQVSCLNATPGNSCGAQSTGTGAVLMRKFQTLFLLAIAIGAPGILGACSLGLTVPEMQEPNELRAQEKFDEIDLAAQVQCEIHKGVQDALLAFTNRGPKRCASRLAARLTCGRSLATDWRIAVIGESESGYSVAANGLTLKHRADRDCHHLPGGSIEIS